MLYIYHPMLSHSYPGLADDIDAFDELGILHGDNLLNIPRGSVVVPRFRMLPFGKELEQEIISLGSVLVNSYREHRSIANLFNWVHLLKGLTPAAHTISDIPWLPEGEYFLKGETNSKKSAWFESAYAPNKASLIQITSNLLNDQWVGTQEIAIRPFQKYREIGEAVNGRPIFHERRAFYLDGQLLSEAHYWNVDDYGAPAPLTPGNYELAMAKALSAVGELARFLVIDYAEYEDGSWGVVELNDGSMSGLSANNPKTLWGNFLKTIEKE